MIWARLWQFFKYKPVCTVGYDFFVKPTALCRPWWQGSPDFRQIELQQALSQGNVTIKCFSSTEKYLHSLQRPNFEHSVKWQCKISYLVPWGNLQRDGATRRSGEKGESKSSHFQLSSTARVTTEQNVQEYTMDQIVWHEMYKDKTQYVVGWEEYTVASDTVETT